MSRQSEGRHNRKLHQIVSKPESDGKPNIVKSEEATNATNGARPAKKTWSVARAGKQETDSLTDSKPDQHLAERSNDRGTNTCPHEGLGHNIERLKEVLKRRLLNTLGPSKARKSMNSGLRASNSMNDLSSYTLTPGLAGGSNPNDRQCHAYETKDTHQKSRDCCGLHQTDHLIEELEDTREQLKRSLEDKARLQTEVNHLADELYKFKVAQMADQNGAVMTLGSETSADVLGIPMVQGAEQMSTKPMSHPNQKDEKIHCERHEISMLRSREILESQLKILQDQLNKLEQHMEVHKSECQAAAAQSSKFNANIMKVLREMTSVQMAILENSKDCFAQIQIALKSKTVENDQLRRVVLEYKNEMDTLVQQMNATMEEEWSELQEKQDQLEAERERLSRKPIVELKTQIIQLRGSYEQKITRLQEEAKKLEEDNAALEHKYTDLREKVDEHATARQPNSDNIEHTPHGHEGRTTHLEKVVSELQQDMQKMQQSIQSRGSPLTAQERSDNLSSVAVVKPMSQFKNPKYYEDCQARQNGHQTDPIIPLGHNMAGDTQPFSPISSSMEGQSEMKEVIPEPKLLCRTPGCSFKGYEGLGGLCPDCSRGQVN